METDTLIIGGGLSGLWLAWQLEQKGLDYTLIEARGRFGGRVHSHTLTTGEKTVSFDIGPSWFWPGQPRIATLINQLGLNSFLQYSEGELSYEDERGQVQRGRGHASMQGSYRLSGSLTKLIESLVSKIPSHRYKLNTRATQISMLDQLLSVQTLENEREKVHYKANKVVLALPPRVVEHTISFSPALPKEASAAMKNTATWMAGTAKVIACYEKPFWREAGLSGDAMSRRGPMVEIHDASPETGGPYALFGFVGFPAKAREKQKKAILDAALTQFVQLFGDQASAPQSLVLQDWAFEPETATSLDHTPLRFHPEYGLPDSLSKLWDDKLILSSTEVAQAFGGYLEGALEASEAAFHKLAKL